MLKTLKGKISIVFMGLVLLTAVVGTISAVNLSLIERSVNGMMSNNYISIQSCEPMLAALERQNVVILNYIHNDDGRSMNAFYDDDLTFLKYYDIQLQHITEKGEKSTTERILSNYAEYKKKIPQLQKLRDTEDETAAFNYYQSEIIPVFTAMNDDLNRIIALNQTVMLEDKAKTSGNTRTSLEMVVLISLCAVLIGFYISRHYVNKFLRPLQQLTQTISSLKGGRFDLKLKVETNDEIGRLAGEFNEMTARLNSYEQSTKGQLMNERNQSVAIMKSISDPLLVLDSKFKIVMINRACEEFFDITEEQALNKHFLESIRYGQLFDAITDSVGLQAEQKQKIVTLQKGGGALYLNVSVTLLRNESATGFIVLLHNVTDIKELEQAKTDFVATISHEFKTPLTAVLMGASLLENSGLGALNNQQKDVLETIQENAQRLSDFVSELLELSKIESSKSIYFPEPCSMQAISHNSVKQFEEIAKKSGITLTNLIRGDLPLVFADFEKITWVLNNLIGNAVKYTKTGGFITVDAAAGGGTMTVTVTDSGEGIPPEFIDRVFDKFVQVKTDDIEVRGTGLGLSVAKEIITAHHGSIRAESKLGKGSRFIFTLPLYEGEQQ